MREILTRKFVGSFGWFGMTARSTSIRVALGSVPKDGGTFTFYRNLRPALLSYGIDMRCVSVGRAQGDLWEDVYADSGCVNLVPESGSLKRQARAFVDWCAQEDIDIVIGLNSEGILSALPHLPKRVRVVSRCANAFDHGYRITMSGRDRLTKIVALTPRLRDDLVRSYGADPNRIVLIPNGVAPRPFEAAARSPRGKAERLELGFLGRLEHKQKGVMHIPPIVRTLRSLGVEFRLRIAGKGKHRQDMERALSKEIGDGIVEFVGSIGPAEVPAFLAATDIFLFTSHFEGCPNALLEAMMAGAVPVSWTVHGITDFLIDDGRTGYLCDLGNTGQFAARVAALAADRSNLDAMHREVVAESRSRFTDSKAAEAYTHLFRSVMAEPAPDFAPNPWNEFRPDPNFPQSWRTRIPKPWKDRIKQLLRSADTP
jgi:glycosyltransferase involved in cell wall biosynthesis